MALKDYGYCPICGAPCETRERRLGGDDTCRRGHTYPSCHSVKDRSEELEKVDNLWSSFERKDQELKRADDFIREIAWRVGDFTNASWSRKDILANVANYFGVTIKQLEEKMEDAAHGGNFDSA